MADTEPMLAHTVYFSLQDRSVESVKRQVDACRKYLTGHDGVAFFGVGTLAPDLSREVNQKDFDVSLHIVFRNRAAHDAYQKHPRHVQFVEESKAHWARARVFDAYLEADV